jgi:hypothetical protein
VSACPSWFFAPIPAPDSTPPRILSHRREIDRKIAGMIKGQFLKVRIIAASFLLSASYISAAEHPPDPDAAFLTKRLATAPDLSKVEGVKFLQLHRNAEEALEGGKEDHSCSFIDGKGSMTVAGSPESILRRVSPFGAQRINLGTALPMGYYQAQIHVEKGGQAEALEKLANVYRQVFGVVVKTENLQLPVLVLKVDPAKAGHIAGARTFIVETTSVNHGVAEFNGRIERVREFIEEDLKQPVIDKTEVRAGVNILLKFNQSEKTPTRLKEMTASLATQGIFLTEETRKIDCVTVVLAGELPKAASQPASVPAAPVGKVHQDK